jgi:hypothetical protein
MMNNDLDKPMIQDTEKLKKLRETFLAHQISKLPKGTKAQNECAVTDKRSCSICGGFHHPKVIHLDYVGHAALTDRLLDTDLAWNWEPLAFKEGLPAFDATGGLWIRLTVCGVTRLGYGNAAGKAYMDVGAREKEVIGDALRNAAMRFGAALDLWHKGDLHIEEETKTLNKINHITGEIKPSRITPNSGAGDTLSVGRKKDIANIADEVKASLSQNLNVAAVSIIRDCKFEIEEKNYLWSLLDSKQRAVISNLTKS